MSNSSAEQVLQRMSAELKRVAELAGKGQGVDLGGARASDGINQGCNGICGGLSDLGRASEVEVSRAATAAAIYQVRLFKELGSSAAEGINQSCNGICGASKLGEDVVRPATAAG